MYDVTNRDSFDNVRQWMTEIDRFARENVNKLLIGNKCDLEEKREVSYEEGMELAKSFDIPFLEVSAKNSTNIEEAFTKLAGDIHEMFLQNKKIKNKLVPGGGTPLRAPVVIN